MNIAFCYENVMPARGGCETYIADLSRRLVADGHAVHLYACRWDAAALPQEMVFHALPPVRAPRFLRPWRFAAACARALEQGQHDVTVGFDKTWGQDVLYPQGGLHVASAEHNLRKHRGTAARLLARFVKAVDLAHWSYCRLERRQYLGARRPLVVVNSYMVQHHFQYYYGFQADDVRMIRSAIDANRFAEHDRPRRRLEWRERWRIEPDDCVALFVAMNYHLKGLEPLLHGVRHLLKRGTGKHPFRLLVAGNPKTGDYEKLARRLGVHEHVRFAGYCPDTRNCYFAADFLVHPTFYDPCSLVALEALACGLPVITSRFNGASELLAPPREGYILDDPHDHAYLADCMAQLVDPARRKECGRAARHTAAQWTFDVHYRQLLDAFAEAARRKAAA